jgi:DnaK suppressor protein
MTTLELKKFESALQTRARELARFLAQRNQIAIERLADAFDATLLAAERESSAQTLEQGFRLLRQVEAARDRLRDGSFGICLGCEEDIAPKRLQAVPWAAYCVSCQTEAEEAGAFQPRLARAA